MFTEWCSRVLGRTKALLKRRRLEQDLEDEIAFHLDMRRRKLQSFGLSSERARSTTFQRFGNPSRVREETREIWSFTRVESVMRDIGYAARSLRKSPGFLIVVISSLALGIAANSTMFSVLNAEMFKPLRFEEADRLTVIWQTERGHPSSEQGPPIAEVVDWNAQNHSFEEIALTSGVETAPLSRLGPAEMIRVQYVTPNFFHVLRVKPEAGRIFSASEAQDREQTVVISDAFMRRYFQTVSSALGKTFDLSGVESTVAGIMPPGFTSFYGEQVDVWQPIDPTSARYSARKDGGWLTPVGRLRPGVSIGQARQDMREVAHRMEEAYPAVDKGMEDRVVGLREEVSGWARMLYPLVGAVAFVLLIACLNVASLLQSRAETLRKEKTVRAALGASRSRLIQQLLAESGLLAVCGGALGLVLTYSGIKIFLSIAGAFPNGEAIGIDFRVVLFTAVLSIATALLFGLAPAWSSSKPDLNRVLREGDRRTVAGSRRPIRQVLVVCEVALAMVLLVGAGLMIKTAQRMAEADVGYDPHDVLTASIALAEGGKYVQLIPGGDMQRATPAVNSFYERLLSQAAALPGIKSAALVSNGFRESSFEVLGRAAPAPDHRPQAGWGEVSPSFFRTLKIPLKSGRSISDADGPGSPWVAVVNETLAKRYFPHENPVGHSVLMRFESYHVDELRPREIVGVVGDSNLYGRANKVFPAVYCSSRQQGDVFPGGAMTAHIDKRILLRMSSGSSQAASLIGTELRKASERLDPDQPITEIMPMEEHLAHSMQDTRFITHLLEIFAGLALLLATVGVYGVISYFVGERTHEIGIRIALGAEWANVLRLITAFGLKLTLGGLLLGSLLAVALTRVIVRFLFDVSATDPFTFGAVAALLLSVALLACYLPGRRATRIDPMVALRHD